MLTKLQRDWSEPIPPLLSIHDKYAAKRQKMGAHREADVDKQDALPDTYVDE